MVMSFTNKQLAIYDDEEALQTRDPIMIFQFSQIYTVRTLNPGEHETLRVKQSDLKKILMVEILHHYDIIIISHNTHTHTHYQWFVEILHHYDIIISLTLSHYTHTHTHTHTINGL